MNCPYCGHELLAGEHGLPLMSRRQRLIYDTVAAAGRDGITSGDLLKTIYTVPTKSSAGVMRVQVHELNKKLKGQRIKGHRGVGYSLVRD